MLQKVNTSIGYRLRKILFDPLLIAIGDRKRLLLAPDGELNKLPFEVLPLDENRRLIDEYHISYLSTGRDVLYFQGVTNIQPTEPLVFADPDFNLCVTESTTATENSAFSGRHSQDLERNTLYFQDLPGTRTEGEKIAALFGIEPILEGKVLETRLKACCSPYILHLATHGFFLKDQKRDPHLKTLEYLGNMDRLSGYRLENPLLRSGLALAGVNTWLQGRSLPLEAEDGILTAEDVSGLDLLDTELVVLSACETGLGEIRTGEGVFGLRRAFVLAGAKRLVVSLWSVPDRQTQELMTNFYERILKGQPCADALRDAQLEIKREYHNPFYWGAFICQGNSSSIRKIDKIEKSPRLVGKERQQAYLNLAHALVECSGDRARELLNVNQELVDTGLVETIEQVSAKLKQEGDCEAANFLRTIAIQLAAALDNPLSAGTPVEALIFLNQLFRATVGSQGNYQVVYPLLKTHLNHLDERFVQLLQQWSEAVFSTVDASQSILIVHGLFTFGKLIQEFPLGDRASHLKIAQACFEIVQKCNKEVLEEAIRLDPYDPLNHRTLAEVLEAQDRHEEAVRAYQETSMVLFRKAEAWRNLGRYKEALQALDEALALDSNNALALVSKTETLTLLDRYENGEREAQSNETDNW
nr:CHAT domain-containing protein [Scytonema sp. UIC 10036]